MTMNLKSSLSVDQECPACGGFGTWHVLIPHAVDERGHPVVLSEPCQLCEGTGLRLAARKIRSGDEADQEGGEDVR